MLLALLAFSSVGATATPCLTSGRSCGGNSSANDGRCCSGMVCGSTACCSAGCRINGTLYSSGYVNPANSCQSCQPNVSTSSWTALANGATCNDRNACTVGDRCQGGTCSGGTPLNCDDHSACTQDTCDPTRGCVRTTVTCNDSNPCTDDSCDPTRGCSYRNNTRSCSDGNACTTGDACSGGACRPGTGTLYCGDSNPCTDDACDPARGCIHPYNTAPCSDNNPCTIGDACSGGSCRPGATNTCDDANPCTNDSCDRYRGCLHANNTSSCSDGNACTTGDKCSYGVCKAGTGTLPCNDNSRCTTDSCNPASGCAYAPVSCDDHNPCTTDSCDPATGCRHAPFSCDDHNACTTDSCSPTGGCANTPVSCDDSNACTRDSCDRVTGCAHAPVSCDDHNPCTDDSCDPAAGCRNANNSASCDDGNACTRDRCHLGQCVGEAVPCQPADQCHQDGVCDPGSGSCSYAPKPEGTACTDANPCTFGDVCRSGVCQPGGPVTCNDGNACTDDRCDPASGQCVYSNDDTNECTDQNECTSESCSGGLCVSRPRAALGSNGPIQIPDDTTAVPYPSTITIPAGDGRIVSVEVTLRNLTHTFPDDLDLLLVGPTGANALIMSDAGGGGDVTNVTLILSDSAATPLPDAGPLVSGSYRPANYGAGDVFPPPAPAPSGGSALSVFGGTDPAGAWSLYLVDGAAADTGSLEAWSLRITLDCDDGNACTEDSCDPATGCVHVPVICADDGDACTDETCDPTNGCHTAVNCDDGNACTDDRCDPELGCFYLQVLCDDGRPCTDDTCDPGSGCVYTPDNSNVCTDDDPCTDDRCVNGVCNSTTIQCYDGNPCTDDTCDATGHCVYTPNDTNSCSDGNACTEPDGCRAGQCVCLGSGACTLAVDVFLNTGPQGILDPPAVVTSTITVSGVGPYLYTLRATTSFYHTNNADLDVTLTSPAGTIVTLTSDNGGTNDNVFNGTAWDDKADPGNQVPFPANVFPASNVATDTVYTNNVPKTTLTPEEALGAFAGEDPNGVWTLRISDDLAGNTGQLSSWSLETTTLPQAPVATIHSGTNSIPVTILDNSVSSSSLIVTGAGTQIGRVRVTTAIRHTFIGDLDITLTSPGGRIVTLTSDAGTSSSGNDNVYNGTLWDDKADPGNQVPFPSDFFAASNLVTDTVTTNLVVKPTLVPEEPLAAFIGDDPNGTWTLRISDDAGGDTGSLDSWTLEFTTIECAVSCDVVCNDGNPCTDDSCNPASGCVYTPNDANTCGNGDACTDEVCSGGLCVITPVSCDDSNACTVDTCDPTAGCQHAPALCAEDGNPCTTATCDPALGCVNTNNTDPCDDGNPCTAGDTCQDGNCQPTTGNLVRNPGFEDCLSDWTTDAGSPLCAGPGHSGFLLASLGSFFTGLCGDSSFYQTIDIPASGAELSFWYQVFCDDPLDAFQVFVTDTGGNLLLGVLDLCTNTSGWTNFGYNLNPVAGQTVQLHFAVHDECNDNSANAYVDDVSITCPPPAPCTTGTDAETGAPWVVCATDPDVLWISSTGSGGQYHAEEICRSLGYATLGQHGGNCGTECGYCEVNTACETPGTRFFDGGGHACGSDAHGPILCLTVQWECLR